jgi:hypothetical protein
MRLIDADELKEELLQQWFIDILLTKTNSNDMYSALAEKIDSQPTAYDVDKVIEYLEQLRDRFNEKDFAIRGIIEKAIEIVKADYVNKQTNK